MTTATQQTPFDPVNAIQAILAAEKSPPPEVKQPEPKVEVEAKPEPEKEPEAPAQPNATVEGEDAPKGLEISEDELEAIELEVKMWSKDGNRKPEKRTIKELREAAMRLDDYSRNIQDVARQRDEIPQKIREGIESERKVYQDSLKQLNDLVLAAASQELQGVNWNDLAANDPAKYVQLRNRADQYNSALQSIKSKQAEVEAKAKSERDEAYKKAAREARAKLESDIPNFNDDLYQKVMSAAEPFGFKKEEVAEWIDPRAIKLLHAVYEFQQLKPGNPKDKKVVVVPKVVKPQAAPAQTQAQIKGKEAMERLRKSGTVDAAADVIAQRLR